MSEATFQISGKIGDVIYVARGDVAEQVTTDFFALWMELKTGMEDVGMAAAVATVQNGIGATVTGVVPRCEHGDLRYKSGSSSKGPWAGWLCSARVSDHNIWKNKDNENDPMWQR